MARFGLIFCVVFAMQSEARLIGDKEVWPGTKIQSNGLMAYVPDSVDEFRFMFWRHQCGEEVDHAVSSYALAAKAVFLFRFNENPSKQAQVDFLKKVADETGHPEIPRLPIMSDGECNPMNLNDLWSQWGEQMTVFYTWKSSTAPHSDKIVIFNQLQEGPGRDQTMAGGGPGMYIKQPNWGYDHGYYGANHTAWYLYETMAKLRLPEGGMKNPDAKLKPIKDVVTEWRGNHQTWHGLWPEIYPKDEYSEHASNSGTWLPNKEVAYLWKSRVVRHPTKTQRDQNDAHIGNHFNNMQLSGPPGLWIGTPSRPYHTSKHGGKAWPLYSTGEHITLNVSRNDYRTTLDSLYILHGSKTIASFSKHPLGFYQATTQLVETGVQFFTVQVKLPDGSRVTSRPSLVLVSEIGAKPVSAYRIRRKIQQSSLPKLILNKGQMIPYQGRHFNLKGIPVSGME